MKRRTTRELEASKLRARRRRRVLLGWPADRLDEAPRAYVAGSRRKLEAATRRSGPLPAVPDLESHPLVDEAIASLKGWERAELHGVFDAIGRDLVGAFVLARLGGEDPLEALRLERARYARDRKWLVFGTVLASDLVR